MSYASWRITFQSSEQAARAAFEAYQSEREKRRRAVSALRDLCNYQNNPPFPIYDLVSMRILERAEAVLLENENDE